MLRSLSLICKNGLAYLRAARTTNVCTLLLCSAVFSLSITSCTSQQAVEEIGSGSYGMDIDVSGGGQTAGARAVFTQAISAMVVTGKDRAPVPNMIVTFTQSTKSGERAEIYTSTGITDETGLVYTRVKAPNKYNDVITITASVENTTLSKSVKLYTSTTGAAVAYKLNTTHDKVETADVPFGFTITAIDENGNTVTSFNETVPMFWTFDAINSWAANPTTGFGVPVLPPASQSITFENGVYTSPGNYKFMDSIQTTKAYVGDGVAGLSDVFAQEITVLPQAASKVIVASEQNGPNGVDNDINSTADNAIAYYADFALNADTDTKNLYLAAIDSAGNWIQDVSGGTWTVTGESPANTISPYLSPGTDYAIMSPTKVGSATVTVSLAGLSSSSRKMYIDPGVPTHAGVTTSQTFPDNSVRINEVQAGIPFDVIVEAQDRKGNKCIQHFDGTHNYAAIMNVTFQFNNAVDVVNPHKVANGCPVFSKNFSKTRKYSKTNNCVDVLTDTSSVTLIEGGMAAGTQQGILNDVYMNDPTHYIGYDAINNIAGNPVTISASIPGYAAFPQVLTGESGKITVVAGAPHHYNLRTSAGDGGATGGNFSCYVEDALVQSGSFDGEDENASCINQRATATTFTYYATREDAGGNFIDNIPLNWNPGCGLTNGIFCGQWNPTTNTITSVFSPINAGSGAMILADPTLGSADPLQTYFRGKIDTSDLHHYNINVWAGNMAYDTLSAVQTHTFNIYAKDEVGNTLFGINGPQLIRVRYWNQDYNDPQSVATAPSNSPKGTAPVLPPAGYQWVNFQGGMGQYLSNYLPNAYDKIHIQADDGVHESNIIGDPLTTGFVPISTGPFSKIKITTGAGNTGEDWTGTLDNPITMITKTVDEVPITLFLNGYDAEYNFKPEALVGTWGGTSLTAMSNPNDGNYKVLSTVTGTQNVFTPFKSGTGTITASYGGAETTANITILPGAFKKIFMSGKLVNVGGTMTPEDLLAGQTYNDMRIQMADKNGNLITDHTHGTADKPLSFSWGGMNTQPTRLDGGTAIVWPTNSIPGNPATYYHFEDGVVTNPPPITIYKSANWYIDVDSGTEAYTTDQGGLLVVKPGPLDHFWVYRPGFETSSDYQNNSGVSLAAGSQITLGVKTLDQYTNQIYSSFGPLLTFSITSSLRGQDILTATYVTNPNPTLANLTSGQSDQSLTANFGVGQNSANLTLTATQSGLLTYDLSGGSPNHIHPDVKLPITVSALSTIAKIDWEVAPPAHYTASNTNAMPFFQVKLQDVYDNTVTSNSNENISIALTTADATPVATLPNDGSYGTLEKVVTTGVATFGDLIYPRHHTLRITATDEHGHSVIKDVIVDYGAVTQVIPILKDYQTYTGGVTSYADAVTGSIPDQVAGTPINVELRAVDDGFNTVESFTGNTLAKQVRAISNDPNFVPLAYGYFNLGVYATTVTDYKAGTGHLISAQATTGTPLDSAPYNILKKSAKRLVVGIGNMVLNQGAPSFATAFSGVTPPVQTVATDFVAKVYATDDYFNLVDDSTTQVTLLAPLDTNATTGGTKTLDHGIATYNNVNFLRALTEATLTTSSDSAGGNYTVNDVTTFQINPGPASQTIVVLPGQTYKPGSHATHLRDEAVTGTPNTGTTPASVASTDGTFDAHIYAVDDYYNTVTTYTGGVTVSSSYAQDTLTPYAPVTTNFVAGYAKFAISPVLAANGQSLTPASALDDNTSDNYNVRHGAALRLIPVFPNQTFNPGQVGANALTNAVSNYVAYPQPIATHTAGAEFTVSVKAVDAKYNVITSDNNSKVKIYQSDWKVSSPAAQTLVNGVADINVTDISAGSNEITVSQFSGSLFAYFPPVFPSRYHSKHNIATQTVVTVDNQFLDTGSYNLAQAVWGSVDAQGVNRPFTARFYAVDDWFNIADSSYGATPFNGAITVTSTDGTATLPSPGNFVNGYFSTSNNVTHTTAGNGVKLTAVTTLTDNDSSPYDVWPNPPSITNSTITGTGPVVADNLATSTVTITLRDDFNNPVSGITPTFSATDTGVTNSYSSCSVTDVNGVSTCTLKSTKAEVKTLSITYPVTKSDGTVTFIGGTAHHLALSQAPELFVAAGTDFVTQPIAKIVDLYGNTVPSSDSYAGDTLQINLYSDLACSSILGISVTNGSLAASNGIATYSGVKTTVSGTYYIGVRNTSHPTITLACATSTTTVTPTAANKIVFYQASSTTANAGSNFAVQPILMIADQYGNAVASTDAYKNDTIQLDAFTTSDCSTTAGTGTLANNTKAAVSAYASFTGVNYQKAESIYIRATDITAGHESLTSACSALPTVISPLAASSAESSITGTGPIVADNTSTSTITIVLKDIYQNPIIGTVPTFNATDTGGGNNKGTCSATDNTGTSTCTLRSTKAETKTLSVATPIAFNGGTVSFIGGAATKLLYLSSPDSAIVAGTNFTTQPSVAIADFYGNTIDSSNTTYGSDTISLTAYTTSDCSTTLAGGSLTNGSLAATNGVATFSGVNYPLAPMTIYIKAADTSAGHTGLTSACAGPVVVSSGPANKLVFYIPPSTTATAGTDFAIQPVVRIADALGNVVQGSDPYVADTIELTKYTTSDCSTTAGTGTLSSATMAASGGTATFSGVDYTKAESIYLKAAITTAGHTGLTTACTAQPVVVSAAAANSGNSSITGTGPIVADTVASSTVTITLIDAYGNPLISTVPTFSATDTNTTNNYGVCSATNASGVSTCSLKSGKAETKTLSISTPISLSGGTVSFIAGAPSKLVISQAPSTTVIAGVDLATQPVYQITDSLGNLINSTDPYASDTIRLSAFTTAGCTNAGAGTLSSTDKAAVNGVATYTGVDYTKAESIYIKATDITNTIASVCTSVPTVVSAAPANKLAFTTYAATTATAGVNFTTQPVLQIQDQFGNLIQNSDAYASDTIQIEAYTASNCTGAGGGTFGGNSVSASNGTATFTASNYNKTGTYYFLATDTSAGHTGLTSACSGVGHTTVVSPNTAVAGNSSVSTATTNITANNVATSTFNVTLKDNFYPNFVANGTAVTCSSTGSGNTCSCGTTTNGVAACTLKSTVAESKTITITSPVSLNVGTVTFLPGAATKVVFVTQPSTTATAGVAFAQQPVVQIQDAQSNIITTASGIAGHNDNITLTAYTDSACTTTAGIGTVNNPTVAASNGTATFTNTNYTKAETIYLRATDSTRALTTACTGVGNGIAVGANVATKLGFSGWAGGFTGWPSNGTAGVALGTQPVVQIQDTYGNLVLSSDPKASDTVLLTAYTDSACTTTLSTGNFTNTSIAAVNGTATFSGYKSDKKETIYLKATDSTNGGITSTCTGASHSVVISANTAVAGNSSVTTPTTNILANGVATSTFTATFKDNYNNGAGNLIENTAVTCTATGGTGNTCTCGTTSNGVVACTLKSTSSGTKTITLNGAIAGFAGGTATFLAGAVSQLAFSTYPTASNTVAGVAFATQPVVQLLDAQGNIVDTASGQVSATDTITLTAYTDSTCTTTTSAGMHNNAIAAVGGIATFTSLSHDTATTVYYKAADTTRGGVTTACTGVSHPAAIVPDAVNKIAYTTLPSTSATSQVAFSQQPVVKVQDQYGNTITSGTGATDLITLSAYSDSTCATPQSGAISSNTATASGGVATFSGLKSNLVETLYFKATDSTRALSTICTGAGNGTTITPAGPNAGQSSVTNPTGPVTADGTSTSTFTATWKDASGNLVANGTAVTCSATNTGTTNTCTCSSTSSGVSNCSLKATYAETKTVTVTAAGVNINPASTVVFNPGPATKVVFTTYQATTANAGINFGTPVIQVQDVNNNKITTASGVAGDADSITLTAFTDTGCTAAVTNGTLGGGSLTASNGSATTSSLTYTYAETIYLKATDTSRALTTACTGATHGTAVSAGTAAKVVFTTYQSTTGTSQVALATQPVVKVQDTYGNTLLSGTGASDLITLTAFTTSDCSTTPSSTTLTNATATASAGVATFAGFKSSKAETVYFKATDSSRALTTDCTGAGHSTVISPASASAGTSTVGAANTNVVADNVDLASFNVTLRDASSNLVADGVSVTCSGSGTGNTCSCGTTVSGVAACTLKSTVAETKSIGITAPVVVAGGSTTFIPGAATKVAFTTYAPTTATAGSSFSTSPVVKVLDANNNVITTASGVAGHNDTITLTAYTDSGCTSTPGAGSFTNGSIAASNGVATFSSLSYSKAPEVIYILATDVTRGLTTACTGVGKTTTMSAGAASASTSTITGDASALADGSTAANVTITLKDANGNFVQGQTPSFTATNTGSTNTYQACSSSNASGVSTCTMKSTRAENKVLSLTSPAVTGSTIAFNAITFEDIYGSTDAWGSQTTNVSHTYTLKNKSSATTSTLGTISVTGTDPGAWTVQSDNCSGITLAASTGSCTVTLIYNGSTNSSGSYSASVSYTAAQPNGGTASRNMTGSNP